MKILLVSLYHPELVRGGAQQVCYELFKELSAREDMEPVLLAAIDPSHKALYKSGARITGFDGRPNEFLYLSRDYDYTWHKCGNRVLAESFAEFLQVVQPDVVHFHHFLLLGVDLITLTRRVLPHCRIIFTFHEFLSICDAYGHMLRLSDNALCTKASPVRCHQCFPDRRPEHFFLRELWFKRHLSAVDAFTVPSRFMIERYRSWGIEQARLHHVTNGQPDYSQGAMLTDTKRSKRNRFGFFGQLVDNKGVWVLLDAVKLLRSQGFTDFQVEINGDNLQFASEARRNEFNQFLEAERKLPLEQRVATYAGPYSVDQLPHRMARVDWCVVPSVWWEIFGLVISEAWMFKRPVIASNVGGPAERITHGKDGLLFGVGDSSALADAIRRACTEKGLWDRLVQGIAPAITTQVMADGYVAIYGLRALRPSTSVAAAI
jgi:glycosyltransferase involved in cell wall biosynthesis